MYLDYVTTKLRIEASIREYKLLGVPQTPSTRGVYNLAESNIDIPPYNACLWPIVEQLRAHGSSMTIEEMVDAVSTAMGLSDAQREIPHGPSGQTEVGYRMAWARTYLKKAGVLENSERGVWRLTPLGLTITATEVAKIPKQVVKEAALARKGLSVDNRAHLEDALALLTESLRATLQRG